MDLCRRCLAVFRVCGFISRVCSVPRNAFEWLQWGIGMAPFGTLRDLGVDANWDGGDWIWASITGGVTWVMGGLYLWLDWMEWVDGFLRLGRRGFGKPGAAWELGGSGMGLAHFVWIATM